VASDFHGSAKAFKKAALRIEDDKADAVILCGDITNFGSVNEARYLLSHITGLRIPIMFIPGNCDPRSLIGVNIEGARCIHGMSERFGEKIFFGVGGGLISPFKTPFELDEKEILNIFTFGFHASSDSSGIILVSHSPPHNTRVDKTFSGEHIGSIRIREFIEKNTPLLQLCGHVHEARGIDQIGETLIINTGSAKDGYYVSVVINEKTDVFLECF